MSSVGVRIGLRILQPETVERLRRELQAAGRSDARRAGTRAVRAGWLAPASKGRSALAAYAKMQGVARS